MEEAGSALLIAESAQVKQELEDGGDEVVSGNKTNLIVMVQQQVTPEGAGLAQLANDQAVDILKHASLDTGFSEVNQENGLEHQYTTAGDINIAEIAAMDGEVEGKLREDPSQLAENGTDVASCHAQVKEEQEVAALPQQFVILARSAEEAEGACFFSYLSALSVCPSYPARTSSASPCPLSNPSQESREESKMPVGGGGSSQDSREESKMPVGGGGGELPGQL